MRVSRRFAIALTLGASVWATAPAWAADPAEAFIAENIQKGLSILNDTKLSADERSRKFADLLISMTDTRRIALFTLGRYAATAPQADQDAFVAAFQDYSLAVYRSYLGKYAGQRLEVTGSRARTPDDVVVTTVMIDPHASSGQQPLQVSFRVRSDSGKPVLTDFSVAGVWLALAQRDEFASVLAASKGDVNALTAHLRQTASQYH